MTQMKQAGIALLLLVLAAWAAPAAPEAEAPLKAETVKDEDGIVVTSSNGTAVVTVSSVSGIGGAKLTPAEGTWPTNIIIRLPLRNLESFGISSPTQSVAGTLAHPGELKIKKAPGYILVEVPQKFIRENPAHLQFAWIDAFRQ